MIEKIQKIADHYGLSHQLTKTVEELNELSIECAKSWKKAEITTYLIAEIADVLVMITQIIYLGKIEWKEVEDVMKYKVDRQIQRIKKAEEEKMKEKIKENKMKIFNLMDFGDSYEELMTLLSEYKQKYVFCCSSASELDAMREIESGKAHVEVYNSERIVIRSNIVDPSKNPHWAGDHFGEYYYESNGEIFDSIAFCNEEDATAYLRGKEDDEYILPMSAVINWAD